MVVSIETSGGVTFAQVVGTLLNAANAKEFLSEVETALEPESTLVVDLREVRFVDSTGLGAIVSGLRKAKAMGSEMCLCELAPPVRSLIELVRMHKVFDIYNTRDEFLATVRT